MSFNFNSIRGFIRNFLFRFKDDEVTALGAQITYYLILSFFPFLIFLITLASYTTILDKNILKQLAIIMPPNALELMFETQQHIASSDRETFLSFGMITSIWSASNGVGALIRGINKAYDLKESRPFWKVKIISIVFTLALGVLIIFSLILLVFGEAIGQHLFNFLGFPKLFKTVWNYLRYIILLSTMAVVFTSIYYHIPNRKLNFKEVLPGSIFAIVGWITISTIFSYYINNFDSYSNTYGSIGGIIILLLWLYWSSIIILVGGEINATLSSKWN